MSSRGASLWIALLSVTLLLQPGVDPVAAQSMATVIGTDEADLLSCPRPSCDVIGEVPLDAAVSFNGEAVNGYIPVRYQEQSGFIAATYLNPADASGAPPRFFEGSAGCNRVALIFNIGSGFTTSLEILDTLVAEDVPATMFIMGWWAEQNGDIVRRMDADGFPIGSHGYLPPELTVRTDEDVAGDVRSASFALEAALGKPPGPWFTPYAAAMDDRVRAIVAAEGFLPVSWLVKSEDWSPDATATSVYDEVVPYVYDGAIVELHLDASTSVESTAAALPWIIHALRDRGYQFVTIPEMLEPCPVADTGLASPVASPAISPVPE